MYDEDDFWTHFKAAIFLQKPFFQTILMKSDTPDFNLFAELELKRLPIALWCV